MQDPVASWAAIISAIATFVVAIATLCNIKIAKRTLELMQQKESRWSPFLELYHQNSLAKRLTKENIRLYLVELRIANISDADNSVKEMNLIVRFHKRKGVSSNIIIPSLSSSKRSFIQLATLNGRDILEVPFSIKARTARSGWIIFKVEDSLFKDSAIESYELQVIDTHNVESLLEIITFGQEKDEERSLA